MCVHLFLNAPFDSLVHMALLYIDDTAASVAVATAV